MTEGAEVVEDYRTFSLDLRRPPAAFLRDDLARRRTIPAAELAEVRDGAQVTVAGLVLVRQKPGSAKGVMFITIEDETGIANLIVWPKLFEQQRQIILTAGMMGCSGRVQREGGLTHVIASRLTDLSDLLHSVGGRDQAFPLATGRDDAARHGSGPDARDGIGLEGRRARDIYIPDLRLGSGIRVRARDFR